MNVKDVEKYLIGATDAQIKKIARDLSHMIGRNELKNTNARKCLEIIREEIQARREVERLIGVMKDSPKETE